jgi:tripartite-type tricarboxylate transporter receptor subunit TctC
LTPLALACTSVKAQPYPNKPITLVVPFAAGGPTDVVASMMAIPMGKSLGQSVVVENFNGAGNTVGATKVARAAPNWYTIFLHHMGMSTSPALYKKLSFDPLADHHRRTLGIQVSVIVQNHSDIEGPKPDLLRLDGGGLQRSLGKARF